MAIKFTLILLVITAIFIAAIEFYSDDRSIISSRDFATNNRKGSTVNRESHDRQNIDRGAV